jgi:TorA maturation chaperone TorD
METALARAALYNFLAAAFGDPPTPELMGVARETFPEAALPLLDDLRQAYTRLLVGPGTSYVPPYASVYLNPPPNGKPQLWGAEAAAVEALYREAGLEVAPGQPRVPDHLALELQFMQHLCAREADALARSDFDEAAAYRDRQRAFVCDHLWPWLSRFGERVAEADTHPVYGALAELALAVVQSDMESHPLASATEGQ